MNKLEKAAEKLGMNVSFKKMNDISGNGWYLIAKDGYQRKDWLGRTLDDALIEFESRYDGDKYATGLMY